jgi:hypothetical protein
MAFNKRHKHTLERYQIKGKWMSTSLDPFSNVKWEILSYEIAPCIALQTILDGAFCTFFLHHSYIGLVVRAGLLSRVQFTDASILYFDPSPQLHWSSG